MMLAENGASLEYIFNVVVDKDLSGRERRLSYDDLPAEKYTCQAQIRDNDVRMLRSLLQRAAAGGAMFQLGLPHEEVSIIADASGTYVYTTDTTIVDWTVPGQRVLIVAPGGDEHTKGIIQAVDSGTLAIYVEPGNASVEDIARYGGRVMPTVPVFFDTQLSFVRSPNIRPTSDEDDSTEYLVAQEVFRVTATNALVGFLVGGKYSILELKPPIANSGHLLGLTFISSTPGADRNGITVQFEAAVLGVGVNLTLTEDLIGLQVLVRFRAGVATVQNLIDAAATATLVQLDAPDSVDRTLTIQAFSDEFIPTPMTGGADNGPGTVGVGASVTIFDGAPVYDRGLVLDQGGTVVDSIQALTHLVELDGSIPHQASDTIIPDWARGATFESEEKLEQQWFKAFWAYARGPQCVFWLPTWRPDLKPTGFTDGTVGVAASLPLLPTLVNSGVLEGLTIVARVAGAGGNAITIIFVGDALSLEGDLEEDTGAQQVIVRFVPGITTADQIQTLVNASSTLVEITGTASGGELSGGDDEFGETHLYDGIDGSGSSLILPATDQVAIDNAGGIGSWWPNHDHLQIQQADGTITYAKIINVENVPDETHVILDAALSDATITCVSWLERCRLEDNVVQVQLTAATWSSTNQCRVVQQ